MQTNKLKAVTKNRYTYMGIKTMTRWKQDQKRMSNTKPRGARYAGKHIVR